MTAPLPATLTGPITAIHERAGANGDLSLAPSIGGAFWRSLTRQPTPVTYVADVPAGLHIGAGLARLSSRSDRLGGFDADGPLVTVLRCTETTPFGSTLGRGPAHACGLWIAPDQLDAGAGEAVTALLAAFPSRCGLWAGAGIPAATVLRLCAPFDAGAPPEAQALARQARALELIAAALTWAGQPRTIPGPLVSPRLEAVRRRLDASLRTPPDLETLAREAGLSRRALTEGFRRAYGQSVGAYLADRRLELAASLLESGQPVNKVAYDVGYAPAHFSVVFRRRFGQPPSRFRR